MTLAAGVFFPNSWFWILDNIPAKFLLTELNLLGLAVLFWVIASTINEPSAVRVALLAWRTSLLISTATIVHPMALLSMRHVIVERYGLDISFSDEVVPTALTLLTAGGVMFCFTMLYVLVKRHSDMYGKL